MLQPLQATIAPRPIPREHPRRSPRVWQRARPKEASESLPPRACPSGHEASRVHDDAELAGAEFSGPSWSTWRVIARLIDGDAHLLTAEEQELALELTGRTVLPTAAPREVYVGAGRRSGKSRFGALVATWLAAAEYPQLARGETAIVAHIAPDKRQAEIDLGYARGLVKDSELLRAELIGDTQDTLSLLTARASRWRPRAIARSAAARWPAPWSTRARSCAPMIRRCRISNWSARCARRCSRCAAAAGDLIAAPQARHAVQRASQVLRQRRGDARPVHPGTRAAQLNPSLDEQDDRRGDGG